MPKVFDRNIFISPSADATLRSYAARYCQAEQNLKAAKKILYKINHEKFLIDCEIYKWEREQKDAIKILTEYILDPDRDFVDIKNESLR